jgi:hypothetical protein
MKVDYQRSTGKRLPYEITTDRHGSYGIALSGKVMRQVATPQNFFGKGRYGSKAKEAAAVEAAKADIEALRGFEE